jgi:ribosomal protein S18 acetylase RimI-like enzyme
VIRHAALRDLAALVELERRCFDSDLISRRSFRHLLARANAAILAADQDGRLAGYALVQFSRGAAVARLSSIAVDSALRGRGIGRGLLAAAEAEALARGCGLMRAEVRLDNHASLALFEGSGYHRIEVLEDYYEDHMGAYRFERTLAPRLELTR